MKNCFDYTKRELRKMKREELLHILYEQETFYYESANSSNKNWSKETSLMTLKSLISYTQNQNY